MKRLREQLKIFRNRPDLPFFQKVWKLMAGTLDAYHLHLSESVVTNIMAIVVGVVTGYGAVGFRWLIGALTEFWNGSGIQWLENSFPIPGRFAFLPVPIIGMIIVSLLVENFAKEAKGHGVPEVMEAVSIKRGQIRGRVAVIKSLASSVCIGFGGSVGREGPIVQIGAALGSAISTGLRMSSERRKWLIACGAGAGIGATFNAPIAGVVFAMEVILHGSSLRSFTSIVFATVSASIIGRMYFGDVPAFDVPSYTYESNLEILFYIVLGIAAAAVSIGYTRCVYFAEDIFARFKLPPIVIAMIGGLLIGIIGSIYPEVRGVGYQGINDVLNLTLVWQMMLVLMFVKLIATSITLGAGGSGGIFAPALFIGAMLGGVCGTGYEAIAPDYTADVGSYILVGMASVFAASAHAPFTAIMILFELTGNYNIILPLMVSVVVATFIANHFMHGSIYTIKLLRRGIRLKCGANIDLLESIKVRDMMGDQLDVVYDDTTKAQLYGLFMVKHHNGFPVLDKNDRLIGIATLTDYYNAEHLPPSTPVDRFCSHNLLTASPDDDLSTALRKMSIRDIGRLPVVSDQDPTHMVGIITRTDVLQAYEMALRRQQSDDAEMSMTDE
jgi:CIC family chloride channel protein